MYKNATQFGYSNIGAYLPSTLQRINGRTVIVSIDEAGIKIEADPTEEVYGIYYTGEGNCCAIPEDDLKTVCKPSTDDCCIFLACSGNGFECLKFSGMSARMLLDRYGKKEMNATRIGNCAILGRKE